MTSTLTVEQIETIRKLAERHNFGGVPIPQLCDLAIQSLSSASGTREEWVWWNKGDGIAVGPRNKGCEAIVFSVDEAQAICKAVNAPSPAPVPEGNWNDREVLKTWLEELAEKYSHTSMDHVEVIEKLRAKALDLARRVEEAKPALGNLVSLLLQTMEPIGSMRSREDYPPELQTAINVLRHLDSRTGKEHG